MSVRQTGRFAASGTVLGYCRYAPSFTQPTTTSATAVDIDATNLVVTFKAPASGAVMVQMIGYISMTTAGTLSAWCLRDGSTTVNNSVRYITDYLGQKMETYLAVITGLTPGTSYTWKWGWYRPQGGGTLSFYMQSGTYEPTMVVTAI
jgi:hypothetical protein